MSSPSRRLRRDDWLDAAVRALDDHGPDAVAIEPLAAVLGTTKGSGYHHFSSRAELLGAALDRYRALHTADLITTTEAVGGAPRVRLEQLLGRVLSAAGERGEFRLYASADPLVVACVRRMTEDRLRYLRGLFVEFGLAPPEARRRALIGYFAYLGQGAVADSVPEVLPRTGNGRAALTSSLIEALLA